MVVLLAMMAMMATSADAVPAGAQQVEVPTAQKMLAIPEQVSSELWVYRDQQPIHGFLTRLTPDELTLVDEDHQEQIIPLGSIWRIERSGDSIWNGFAIGATLGLVDAVIMGGEVRGHASEKVAFSVYAAGICGLIGAGIDAMHVGRTTVYQVPRKRPGPAIEPSRDGRGALLSWTVRF
jgi:hypothetical protein